MNPFYLAATLTALAVPVAAQTAPNACGLLTGTEVERLIVRGQKSYGQTAEATPRPSTSSGSPWSSISAAATATPALSYW